MGRRFVGTSCVEEKKNIKKWFFTAMKTHTRMKTVEMTKCVCFLIIVGFAIC